jgi:hypothetical protein
MARGASSPPRAAATALAVAAVARAAATSVLESLAIASGGISSAGTFVGSPCAGW